MQSCNDKEFQNKKQLTLQHSMHILVENVTHQFQTSSQNQIIKI